MRVVGSLVVVGLVAALALVVLVALGGLGSAELTLWLVAVAVGLVAVTWREGRRGRRERAH
jgi:hypothetical protein